MNIRVNFFSYFKELTGTASTTEQMPDGSSIEQLQERLRTRFPKLAPMRKSTLIAVGVEYQGRDYILKDGDEVSFFPPVQGG